MPIFNISEEVLDGFRSHIGTTTACGLQYSLAQEFGLTW